MADPKKKSNAVWIIIIIVLVVLLIGGILLTWFITRRVSGTDGLSGDTCATDSDCVTGLQCTAGVCGGCVVPSKVIGIDDDQTLDFPNYDVELTWDAATGAEYYIVYISETEGFDYTNPDDLEFTQITEDNEFLFEGVPASSDIYLRIVAFNECGAGTPSNEYTFSTGPII